MQFLQDSFVISVCSLDRDFYRKCKDVAIESKPIRINVVAII